MKNKKNIYILLPAVLIVWGFVGYRIFSAISPKNKSKQDSDATTNFKPRQLQEAETFTINTNYRDPFLGTISKIEKKRSKRKKITEQTDKAPFPSIVYKGLVSSNLKNSHVFIISIEGQQYFFKKNNTQQELKLVRGNSKEVVLRFQGQQKSFSLAH